MFSAADNLYKNGGKIPKGNFTKLSSIFWPRARTMIFGTYSTSSFILNVFLNLTYVLVELSSSKVMPLVPKAEVSSHSPEVSLTRVG